MSAPFRGLENRLEGIKVGFVLCLINNSGDMAVGFVRDFSSTTVKLSHEPLANTKTYGNIYFPRVTIGDRTYPLHAFSDYKILVVDKSPYKE